ncbi:MAG: ABC transporter ATP-binding protein [Bosea sp.]|nr:ABC transporter ATP-binding protein [Bosea sp. (in: a-proteobacteria)]
MSEPAPRKPIIDLEGVSLAFGPVRAVSDVWLTIASGEFFTLLGPSGCGKTSLLRILAGFETPTSGRVRLEGTDVTTTPPHLRPVNTVFQSYALFPHMTVAENAGFGLEMLGWPKQAIRERVAEVLALVGLAALGDRRPDALSGGQQQRVALGRALAPKPRVLLLDEPMSALDLKLRKEMQNELRRLHREAGITFVLVTHDQEEALALSDRVGVMKEGEIQQIATPRDIYRQPVDSYVADFIGEANLIPAGELDREGGGLVMVRPEDVSLAGKGVPVRIEGRLLELRFLGSIVEAAVATPGGTMIRARFPSAAMEEVALPPGETVGLAWPDAAERHLER